MVDMTSSNTVHSPIYVGVDVGASHTKVALIDAARNILGHAVKKSGVDFSATANDCLAAALDMANCRPAQIMRCISTGYGRHNVAYADGNRTEIGCHGQAGFFYFPEAITVIDIGGQDNKIIKLDSQGRRISFKMNRKCAAGTGAFLEEMSARLDIPLSTMNALARQSTETVTIGSYCTVFSATEVLDHIRHGKRVQDIVKALYLSVIRRVLEMDTLTSTVVMTGGVVAHHPFLIELAASLIDKSICAPPRPQLAGAIGAALYAKKINHG
jgi:predicted CoA-substrate-specific enzyme activase